MSSTIYGGRTFNDMAIDDMVDDNRDYIYEYPNDKAFFARLSITRETLDDEPKPAIVLFHEDAPFTPLYAMQLEGEFRDYTNNFGWMGGDKMEKARDTFWQVVDGLSLPRLKEFMKTAQ